MHQVAALILSLGVGVQIARLLQRREERALSFFRRSIAVLIAAATLSGVVGASWNGWRERGMVKGLAEAQDDSPNLLLITLDTLRADHLSAYGYHRPTSPNIDRLAGEGAMFVNAFSNSSWTLPSHASMFTGRLPNEHKADWTDPLDEKYPTLAEALASRGYRCAAFSANTSYVAPEWGLARGFSRFETYGNSLIGDAAFTVYGRKLALNLLPRLGYYDIPGRKRASEINREFYDWLEGNGERPFFAFLNYFDLHDPYLTVAPHRTRFSDKVTRGNLVNFQFQPETFRRKPALTPEEVQVELDSYDGCLAYLDAQLGELMAELARRGLDKKTLIIVTSDHGESFGSHDLFGHGNSLYLETLRVPLIFDWPGKIASGARFSEVVSLRQVPSTVMEFLNLSASSPFPGESLAGLMARAFDKPTSNIALSELSPGRFRSGPPNYPTTAGGLKSLVTAEYHLIVSESGRAELYRWQDDPQEARNLAGDPQLQPVVERLKQQLESLMSPYTTRGQEPLKAGSDR
jgi:arylsulfatase A-like enzyme